MRKTNELCYRASIINILWFCVWIINTFERLCHNANTAHWSGLALIVIAKSFCSRFSLTYIMREYCVSRYNLVELDSCFHCHINIIDNLLPKHNRKINNLDWYPLCVNGPIPWALSRPSFCKELSFQLKFLLRGKKKTFAISYEFFY